MVAGRASGKAGTPFIVSYRSRVFSGVLGITDIPFSLTSPTVKKSHGHTLSENAVGSTMTQRMNLNLVR